MLRYWSDSFSDGQAQSIAATILRIFEASLQCPFDSISTLSVSPKQEVRTPDLPTPPYDITELIGSKALHKLIDDRVHEILSQILGKNGSQEALAAALLTLSQSYDENRLGCVGSSYEESDTKSVDVDAHIDQSAEYHISAVQREDEPSAKLEQKDRKSVV